MKLLRDPDPGGTTGGNPPADWRATLPEDLRASPVLAKFKSPEEAYKAHINLESVLGKKRAPIPEPSWGDKEWDEFYTVTGRPADASKYTVPEFKFEEGVSIQPELLDKAKLQFHKLGLNDRQAKGVLEYYFGTVNEQFKGTRDSTLAERSAAEEAMKKKFGQTYDAKIAAASAIIAKYDTEGTFRSFLNETKLGNDPRMLNMLASIAERFTEDKSGTAGGGALPLPDKERAKLEFAALKADPEFMELMFNGSGEPQKAATRRYNESSRLAFS